MAPPWTISVSKELEKNTKLKKEDLEEIQHWIKKQPHLASVLIDDEIILHFIHACYYDKEVAKKTLDYFYYYKASMPDFFTGWDPLHPSIQECINEVLIAAPLPNPTKDGLKMIVTKFISTDVKKFNYPICVKWLMMISMHNIWKMGIQEGYVIVYDASGLSFSHCLKCSLSHVKNYIDFGKNAMPYRVVKVVYVNTSSVVEKMLSLVKPFLNKELINMMSFHSNPESFFKDLPKEDIPSDYGGTLPSLHELHQNYVKEVIENREWLMREENIKCDMSKRTPKKEKSEKPRKLEID